MTDDFIDKAIDDCIDKVSKLLNKNLFEEDKEEICEKELPDEWILQKCREIEDEDYEEDEKRNGYHRVEYVDGAVYEGEWKDGMRDGIGKYSKRLIK